MLFEGCGLFPFVITEGILFKCQTVSFDFFFSLLSAIFCALSLKLISEIGLNPLINNVIVWFVCCFVLFIYSKLTKLLKREERNHLRNTRYLTQSFVILFS